MREHPIPTDITNYRFHIIGTMTLKQFGEVALGIILAFLLYLTNLPVVVKWPLIVISVGVGGVAAFIPIAERPLDHWIATFFKALYKPTQFYWKRTERIPEPFLFKPRDNEEPQEEELDLAPYKRQRIKEYLHSVPTETTYNPAFTEDETARMQSILDSFSTTPVTATPSTPIRENVVKPTLSVRVRDIRTPEIHTQAAVNPQVVEQPSEVDVVILNKPSAPKPSQEEGVTETIFKTSTPKKTTAQPSVEITPDEVIQVSPARSRLTTPNTTPPEKSKPVDDDTLLQFPDLPTEPNKIVGMVTTTNNELIPEAIVEVKNSQGEVQRAVKTNALGQFFITTPLLDGAYTIDVEKDEYQFEPYQVVLDGQIVRPIKIQSL